MVLGCFRRIRAYRMKTGGIKIFYHVSMIFDGVLGWFHEAHGKPIAWFRWSDLILPPDARWRCIFRTCYEVLKVTGLWNSVCAVHGARKHQVSGHAIFSYVFIGIRPRWIREVQEPV